MSLPLKDIGKMKVTAETDAWLAARSRITGKSKLEILRAAAHELAIGEIHDAKLLIALARVEELGGDAGGSRGEDEGSRGRGGRK